MTMLIWKEPDQHAAPSCGSDLGDVDRAQHRRTADASPPMKRKTSSDGQFQAKAQPSAEMT